MAFINAAAQAVERSISDVLRHIGENPRREGLKDTPRRYIKALREFTSGYDDAPAEILSTVFKDESFDEMIILRGIEFQSLCEHHLMPFVGTATVGYIPDPEIGIVGLSKLARVVQCYARRLQVQERMTVQIATAINQHLRAHGAAAIVSAKHYCMCYRGANQPRAYTITSCLLGAMRDKAARQEFLALSHDTSTQGLC